MDDWEDTELIECAACKAVLNGKNLWVVTCNVHNNEPKTICEGCHAKTIQETLDRKKQIQ